ncbi:general stress protein [Microbacterium caowuchunii]|uniref:general stress protein n=1 Tax=Microbacterium caowuchunii TaxID=2614638 RepID=UPI0017860892|nr:general stress protein [Microbacterium caowuchunii]
MSMGTPFTAGSAEAGETVASFPNYEGAQKAVSSLIAADVPAKQIAIVGQGLRSIERITGRLGYGAAARSGAVNGLVLGVLFAFIFVLGTPTVAIQAFVGVLLVGMAIGMLMNIIMYSFVRRRRDFASVMQVVADHYEVRVTSTHLGKARAALGAAPMATAAPAAPTPFAGQGTDAATPRPAPRYGERIDPAAPVPPKPAEPSSTPDDERKDAPPAPPRYGERIDPDPGHSDRS